jgi:archaellum component FlaF (FlaF/FlaG flagellin family)
MKRNDGDLPVPLEGLAEERITRARAIKLAGAAVAGGAFSIFWGADVAEARPNRRRRRRRRRRRQRQNNVTTDTSTVNITTPGEVVPVTVTNNGTTPVTITPQLVGEGFSLVNANDANFRLLPGASRLVEVTGTNLAGDGVLNIRDASDGLILEVVDLNGPLVLP